MGESEIQLANRLVEQFGRAVDAEMPARAMCFQQDDIGHHKPSPNGKGGSGGWGHFPSVLIALDGPVVIHTERHAPVHLRVGDALFASARDLLEIRSGGQGEFVGFETLGTQPFRVYWGNAADPVTSRRDLEVYCTPFAHQLSLCWRACHEVHCLLESAQRYTEVLGSSTEAALLNVLKLATVECYRALRAFQAEAERPEVKSNAARVRVAEVFVSCHIGRDIRKSELAKHLGVSVSQLTLAFREIGQLAVRDRIRFRRVESARNLLADTSLSVSEVAERVGMNYRHFIRAFRQNALLTPLRYRKYARRETKSEEVWEKLLHTENFDLVKPMKGFNAGFNAAHTNRQEEPADGAVTVLISNATDCPAMLSRLGTDGAFADLGIAAAQKRLSFLDCPGSIWKIDAHDGRPDSRTAFFKSGRSNSHFVFGAEPMSG
jgi:AraC-like DNA-binding protein